ncbi:MAG: NAD(P)-dependent oxidoreductase, partial [Acidimicrobiia bacterium]
VNASTDDVADHTMALLLALQRRLFPMVEATRSGEWVLRNLPDAWEIRRLDGQTLGILGTGRIGRAVARRARAFGFVTIGHDRYEPDPPDPDLEMVGIRDLFERSDAIAVCASLDPDSRHVVGEEALSYVKPGAYLVNCARGGLIDEHALATALDDGRIRMAALDVRDPEPPDPDNDPLGFRPDVIQTPHMAAMSDRTRIDVHHLVAANVVTMLRAAGRLTP